MWRRRRCSGWGWGGPVASGRAWPPTRQPSHGPTIRTARRRWSAADAAGVAAARRRRRRGSTVDPRGSAPSQLRRGAVRIAVWAYVWLSRSEFLLGSWDRAAAAAERAVSLLEESGHEWLRPLARWVAGAVPAARGEWAAAEEHARLGAAQAGDYELMIVAGSLGRAQVAAAQGDPEAVLRALEPVVAIEPRDGVDEPGFWPWQDLYADALVSTGRLKDAAEFLTPHEELASARGRRSSVAMLARVRGRLEAAAGRPEAAEAAFQRALEAGATRAVALQPGADRTRPWPGAAAAGASAGGGRGAAGRPRPVRRVAGRALSGAMRAGVECLRIDSRRNGSTSTRVL